MLKSRVRCQNRVVRFYNRVRGLRGRVDGELELGLFAVVGRETFKEESTETGTSSTTEGVEDEEALKTVTVVCKTANLVHDGVDHFLAHSVVTTGV